MENLKASRDELDQMRIEYERKIKECDNLAAMMGMTMVYITNLNCPIDKVLGVGDGNKSDDKVNGSDLENLSLKMMHFLGASLVHDYTLSDTLFGILVFLHDWLEHFCGFAALPH